MQITIDVPEQFGIEQTKAEIANTLKRYAALALFQAGKLSAGAAAELADMDRYTFMAECKKQGIPTINYSAKDLQEELAEFGKNS
jgi:predicted HTH domain antitoxin